MGCFDWIAFSCNCPKCGAWCTKFQSKEGPCDLKVYLPCRVHHSFYGKCPECDVWINFVDGELKSPIYDTGAEVLPYWEGQGGKVHHA